MRIMELIGDEITTLDIKAKTKSEVISELATMLFKADRISDLEKFKEEIFKREELGSTGIGFGVAIPHAKTEYVLKPSLVFGLSREGIDYDSLDGEEAHVFFMIAAPAEGSNLHLQTLAKLSRKLIHEEFRDALRNVETKEELNKILEGIE